MELSKKRLEELIEIIKDSKEYTTIDDVFDFDYIEIIIQSHISALKKLEEK